MSTGLGVQELVSPQLQTLEQLLFYVQGMCCAACLQMGPDIELRILGI